jgi:hypothetical protein
LVALAWKQPLQEKLDIDLHVLNIICDTDKDNDDFCVDFIDEEDNWREDRGAVNLAVFSELGVILISIDAIKLSVGFWNHLVNSDEVSLIEQAYKFNFKQCSEKYIYS